MAYAVLLSLAVARMPQPEGYLLGPRKRRKPIPSRGCYFMLSTPPAGRRRNNGSRLRTSCQTLAPGKLHYKLFIILFELSTESLHSPITRLTPGLDAELSCALGDRDRWPMQSLTKLPRRRPFLTAKHALDLPHLLTLGHLLPYRRCLSAVRPYALWSP